MLREKQKKKIKTKQKRKKQHISTGAGFFGTYAGRGGCLKRRENDRDGVRERERKQEARAGEG